MNQRRPGLGGSAAYVYSDGMIASPPQEQTVTVSADELARRTIRKSQYVSCNTAFIDVRMPGSELKENYSIIGGGVTQNPDQVINLTEPHGFNVGAAAMP